MSGYQDWVEKTENLNTPATSFAGRSVAPAQTGFGGGGLPNFPALAREEAALANALRAGQYTPYGAMTWSPEQVVDPTTGKTVTRWNQRVGLSPARQRMLDLTNLAAERTLGQNITQAGAPVDLRGLTAMPGVPGGLSAGGLPGLNILPTPGAPGTEGLPGLTDPSELRGRAEDAVYGRYASRLDPQFAEREAALTTQLRNQGLRPGDQAWVAAMDRLGRERTDAYQAARDAAVTSGRAEAGQLFGQESARRGQLFGERGTTFQQQLARQLQDFNLRAGARGQLFGERRAVSDADVRNATLAAALRRQGMDELMAVRALPLAELGALGRASRSFTEMPRFPQGGYTGVGPNIVDPYARVYQGTLDRDAAERAREVEDRRGFFDAIGTVGGIVGSFISDRRMKRDIERIGTWRGYPLYRYRFTWNTPSVGVMADEVNADAVTVGEDGIARVDYARVR